MAPRGGDRWRANSPQCSRNKHITTEESPFIRGQIKLQISTE